MAEKLILALESSTDKTTVALGNPGNAVMQEEVISNRYSEKIIQLIDSLLRNQNIRLNEIEGFIAGTGPGSFTGTRAGISTIKALAQALRKPAIGVPSTKALAMSLVVEGQIKEDRKILVALDAKRAEIYACLFQYDRKLNELHETSCNLMSYDNFLVEIKKQEILITGSALELEIFSSIGDIDIAPQELWLPQAKYLFSPDLDFNDKNWKNIFFIEPLYWRQSDAIPLAEKPAWN